MLSLGVPNIFADAIVKQNVYRITLFNSYFLFFLNSKLNIREFTKPSELF